MINKIQVEVVVHAPIEKVWEHWTSPESIKGWAFASDTWECTYAENDIRVAGKFLSKLSAKDGSFGFDFTGTYTDVRSFAHIGYVMNKADGEEQGRSCDISFEDVGNGQVKVVEIFDAEHENSEEMQREGWQGFLNNFKKFVEK